MALATWGFHILDPIQFSKVVDLAHAYVCVNEWLKLYLNINFIERVFTWLFSQHTVLSCTRKRNMFVASFLSNLPFCTVSARRHVVYFYCSITFPRKYQSFLLYQFPFRNSASQSSSITTVRELPAPTSMQYYCLHLYPSNDDRLLPRLS